MSDRPTAPAPASASTAAIPPAPSAAYSNVKALWHVDKLATLRGGGLIVPAQIQLILSDLCDQSCHFCNYRMPTGTSTEQFGEMTPKGFTVNPNRKIPTTKAIEILDDAAAAGVKAVQFTGGGEPLVHPDAMAIFAHALDLGLECALVTNLWHLKDGWRDVLPRFSWLRASVDAGSAETYATIRSVPSTAYNTVIANVFSLAQELAWRGAPTLFGVGFVVTPENWREIVPAVQTLSRLGPAYVRLSAMFSTQGVSPYEGIHDKIIAEIASAKALQTPTFKVVDLYGDRISDLTLQAPDYTFCGYQQFNTYIGGNLKVYRCCTTSYTKHGEVGDLSHMRFSDWVVSQQRAASVTPFDARTCHLCQFNEKNRAIDSAVNAPTPIHVNFP